MELAELEIFRAVALAQSVTRAAQHLGRVQSNVTTRLRQLEEGLGVDLFRRDNKRMTLTPQGQRMLDYAERLLALAEEARQAVLGATPSGRLRLGSMEAAAASRLPEPLARFRADWPQVAVEIQTGTTQALAQAVAECRLDAAIVAHPAAGRPEDADMRELGEGLEGRYLFTEELMLVTPPGHPRPRTAADLQVRSLAAFAHGCTYRKCVLQWLAEQGGDPGQWTLLDLNSYDAILACVMAGAAVAVLPRSMIDMRRVPTGAGLVPLRPVHSYLIRRAGFDTAALSEFARLLAA
ncbi:LysR family transcriptional regulator [Bordetella genomosp. 10]|uniref:LysR family transcriptional regulator n=1 Tax=Bordetella genomosp. 10 TaxID=1416804 RepID=A0A261SFJ4_9BORD|nr:LysR substrate-binding domain-containing protein [Bordetella genomosp. 10]OZI35113.1 LysR family transcriptional regulator [Bordetella genomosp. 10]